jgi:hypothetical protein
MSGLWKCPKCGAVLQKGLAGMHHGAEIVGTATCGSCGAKYGQSEVYGGKFDVGGSSTETVNTRPQYKLSCKDWMILFIAIFGILALVIVSISYDIQHYHDKGDIGVLGLLLFLSGPLGICAFIFLIFVAIQGLRNR